MNKMALKWARIEMNEMALKRAWRDGRVGSQADLERDGGEREMDEMAHKRAWRDGVDESRG